MKTVIMAGGKGTRIAEMFPEIPKPLIPISGIPVLEREIINLRKQGFDDIILTVGYMAEQIVSYFGDGSNLGVTIEYYIEESPLGNAGALYKLRDKLTEDFLLLNADAVFDVDFNRFVNTHKESGAWATLFTHPNGHPYDSGLIIGGENRIVSKWLAKEDERPQWYKNRVNAGLHVISPRLLDAYLERNSLAEKRLSMLGRGEKLDLDRDLLKPLSGTGKLRYYDSPEYVKDMGTCERYHSVCLDFENGIVCAKNLMNRQKAIFLDRDGTLNEYVGFLRNIDEFKLIKGATDALKLINESGYLAIVVTNQPVIARGEVSFAELDEIHWKMETLLGEEGAYLDAIYYCPHHPDSGFFGEIRELKIDCDCRKPKPGMLLEAAQKYNIDLSKSWMIGDSDNDVLAGQAVGCKTIKISGEMGLLEAIQRILVKEKKSNDGNWQNER